MRLIFLFLIGCVNLLSGQNRYPYLDKDEDGIVIVILTEEQARKLDNLTEYTLSSLREKEDYLEFADSLCNLRISIINIEKQNLTEDLSDSKNKINQMSDKLRLNELKNNILGSEISYLNRRDMKNQNEISKLKNDLEQKDKKIKLYGRHVNVSIGFALFSLVCAMITAF